MAGLGSLIQGFQSGYDWVDNNQRQAADDKFKGEQRDQQRKVWTREDEHLAKQQQIIKDTFGDDAGKPAAPADVNPSRVMALQQGIEPQVGAVAAPDVTVMPTTPASVVAAPQPAATPTAAPAPVANTGAAVDLSNPGQGRGFVTPPAVSPANPPVLVQGGNAAASKVLNDPANRSALLTQAERQFGMRHRPGTPTEMAQGGSLQNVSAPPTPVPGVKLAADGVEQPVQTKATQIDPAQDVNKIADMTLKLMKNDMAYGKGDGLGMLNAIKLVNASRDEGVEKAVKMFNAGMYQEGQDIFNRTGKESGWQVVSAKDTKYNDQPSKVVTLKGPNGETRTVNTAQYLTTMQSMEKQVEQAQNAQKIAIEGRQADTAAAAQKSTAAFHEGSLKNSSAQLQLSREEFNSRTLSGQIAEKEKTLGRKLTEPEKQELAGISKIPEVVRTALAPLYKQQESITQTIAKAMADNTYQAGSENAKALAEQQAAIALRIRQMTEPYLSDTKAKPDADPLGIRSVKPGDSAQAGAPKADGKPGTGASLAAKGTVPNPMKPDAKPADKDMADAKAWIKDKLIGKFDGPGKYAEIAKSHPDAKIRAAAAALDAEYKANIAANTN